MKNNETCPNCWGYQSYGTEMKDVKIDLEHHTTYSGRVKKGNVISKKS